MLAFLPQALTAMLSELTKMLLVLVDSKGQNFNPLLRSQSTIVHAARLLKHDEIAVLQRNFMSIVDRHCSSAQFETQRVPARAPIGKGCNWSYRKWMEKYLLERRGPLLPRISTSYCSIVLLDLS